MLTGILATGMHITAHNQLPGLEVWFASPLDAFPDKPSNDP